MQNLCLQDATQYGVSRVSSPNGKFKPCIRSSMLPRNKNDRILGSCFSISASQEVYHSHMICSYHLIFCFPGTLSLKVVAARLDRCPSAGLVALWKWNSNKSWMIPPKIKQLKCNERWRTPIIFRMCFNPAELHPKMAQKGNILLHLGFLQEMEAELAKLDLELMTQALAGDLWSLHRPWVAWEADTVPAELPETPTDIEAWEIANL